MSDDWMRVPHSRWVSVAERLLAGRELGSQVPQVEAWQKACATISMLEDQIERLTHVCDCAACKGEASHEGCKDSGCACPCLEAADHPRAIGRKTDGRGHIQ
jgi:hypothetical protein